MVIPFLSPCVGAGITALPYETPLELSALQRASSFSHFNLDASNGQQVEYYFASDASAVIEHTNKVIFLEDDDVAAVKDDGCEHSLPPFLSPSLPPSPPPSLSSSPYLFFLLPQPLPLLLPLPPLPPVPAPPSLSSFPYLLFLLSQLCLFIM